MVYSLVGEKYQEKTSLRKMRDMRIFVGLKWAGEREERRMRYFGEISGRYCSGKLSLNRRNGGD